MTRVGIILGIPKNNEPNRFVVLGFIRGTEYPSLNPENEVRKHAEQKNTDGYGSGPAYRAVWFQETTIPKTEKDG